MISSIQKVKKARELRLFGKSLSEISSELNIPVSTLSFWLKDIRLSEKQIYDLKMRVNSRVSRGRLNASIIHKSVRIFKEKKIFDEASKEFPKLIKEPLFILGLSIYWAKGSMKGECFQFSSMNKVMIDVILMWIKKYIKIDDNIIKKRKYGSMTRIEISGIDVLRKIMAWQKLLIQYYDKVLSV
jgi:hypothetical protein